MSAHTPGPWKALPSELDNDGFVVQTIQSDETKGLIGEIYGGTVLSEPAANARLIAAAPELLEACKAIAGLNSWDLGLPPDPTLPAKGAGALAKVRAAIAKAEGR
jgi:hypothetical protein